jgi:putative peptidoglycan binding protein
MKRTLIAICIGTLTMALGVSAAEDNHGAKGGPKKGKRAATAQAGTVKTSNPGSARRGASTQHFRQSANLNAQNSSKARVRQNNTRRVEAAQAQGIHRNRERTNFARNTDTTTSARVNNGRNVQRERTFAHNGDRNVTINRERNINRRNVTVVNNWRGDRFAGRNYVAFRNYRRSFHDHAWWRSHYNRIIFVSGGWYFWNSGYWYPAWGYDPGYVYPYDGPIYGYGNLTPDQVTVNVQLQLQRDGYYTGPIDGVLGPATREGIAAFQADHGLAITSAIDEPTLATLGLV